MTYDFSIFVFSKIHENARKKHYPYFSQVLIFKAFSNIILQSALQLEEGGVEFHLYNYYIFLKEVPTPPPIYRHTLTLTRTVNKE